MLRLLLLGPPGVELDGARVTFDTRKAVALLALLAVEGRPQPRDRVAALLWPEADALRARSSLRRTLSVTVAATGGAVVADRSLISLDVHETSVDVAEFRRLAAGSDTTDLRAAVDLYRDDFLAGFGLRDAPAFMDWQDEIRASLRRLLGETLGLLLAADTAAGRLDQALGHAQRWLGLDPLHEPAHAALIRLQAARGERAAAVRQYRECVRILDAELGVPPLPETTALYDAVRRDTLQAVPNQAKVHARPNPSSEPPPRPDVHPVVGRDAELAALRAALSHEGAEGGHLVAVTGTSGMGRTTMLSRVAESAARAEARPPILVSVRCHREEASLAFCAVVEMLRALLTAAPTAVADLDLHVRAELARLVPEFADLATPAVGDDPAALARLYAAVRTAVSGLGGPVICVVDDIHWMDVASAGLFAYLSRRSATMPLTLVVAWATDALADNAFIASVRESVADGSSTEIRLKPLDPAATAALLAAIGTELTDSEVERLTAETGGVPALIQAYAHEAVSDSTYAPAALRTALATRIGGLGETTRQVLAAAAVIGTHADPDVLRATCGRGDLETVMAIEDALRSGVLVETGAGEYDVAFESLRTAVLADLTSARRRLLHSRAADALARRQSGRGTAANAGAVAHHLEAAGRLDVAAEWHWRAGVAARDLQAHAEALLEIQAAIGLGNDSATVRMVEGEVLIALGRYGEALTALERSAARIDPDDPMLPRAERLLAEVHHRLGDYVVADAHLAAASDAASTAEDSAAFARLLGDRALVAYRRETLAEARDFATRGLEAGRVCKDAAAQAQAEDVLGMIEAHDGQLAAAESALRRSVDHAQLAEDAALTAAALNNLSRVVAAAGRADEAVILAQEALLAGIRLGDRHRLAALHANLADAVRAAGDTEGAIGHLKEAAALFAGVDDPAQRRPEIWTLVEW